MAAMPARSPEALSGEKPVNGVGARRIPEATPGAAAAAQPATAKPRTILVLASAEPGAELVSVLRRRGPEAGTEVLVVAPALASRIGFWTNDDRWRRRAEGVVARTTGMLAAAGIASRGRVGDADPLEALEDALRDENVAELIIVHSAPERTSWLERHLLRRVGEGYVVPTTKLEAPEGTPSGAGRRWSRRHPRLAAAGLLALPSVLVLAAVGSGRGRLLVALGLVLGIVALNVGPKLAAVAAVWLVVRRRRSDHGWA